MDLFGSSDSSQSSSNQQVGVNTGETGGSVITVGAGGNAHIEMLDKGALDVASSAIHAAVESNTATSIAQIGAYQKALTIAGETAQQALAVKKESVNPTDTSAINTKYLVIGGVVAIGIIALVLLKK